MTPYLAQVREDVSALPGRAEAKQNIYRKLDLIAKAHRDELDAKEAQYLRMYEALLKKTL